MAHASFSVNEQRGIAMNLRFEEEKKHRTENAVSKRSHSLFDYGSSGCISCLADYYVCLKKSKCNWQFHGNDTLQWGRCDCKQNFLCAFSTKKKQIIAFYPEVQDEEETINSDSMIHIRRVAGLPGEKVQIKNGKLYINGEEQKEKYDFEAMHSGGRAVNEITLKDDEYFVLSDSRNDMDDSRNSSFTKVTKKNIIGKVILRLDPFSLIGGPTAEDKKTE